MYSSWQPPSWSFPYHVWPHELFFFPQIISFTIIKFVKFYPKSSDYCVPSCYVFIFVNYRNYWYISPPIFYNSLSVRTFHYFTYFSIAELALAVLACFLLCLGLIEAVRCCIEAHVASFHLFDYFCSCSDYLLSAKLLVWSNFHTSSPKHTSPH